MEAMTVIAARPSLEAWTFDEPARVAAVTAAVAGSIPAEPPSEWFDPDRVPEIGGPLTFTADGQVYGLIAPADLAHIGMPGQRRYAPKSRSQYAYFHTGQVRCADGSLVSTGRITMDTGHADTDDSISASAAAAHYDNTGTAIADVIAWDTPQGVMCAGAARPGLTAEQIRRAMGSPPSGDWRPVGNDLEMVGALLVNVPGFPTSRAAMAASGEIRSLVASGASPFRILTASLPTSVKETDMPGGGSAKYTLVDGTQADELTKYALVEITASGAVGEVDHVSDDVVAVTQLVNRADIKPASVDQALAASAARTERQKMQTIESRLEQLTAALEARDRADQAAALLADIEV